MTSELPQRGQKEVFQLERLLESCEDDAELAREVVEDFLQSTPQVLLRLTQALQGGEAVEARLEAHSLKGSSQTLGAEALAAIGLAMEETAKRGELGDAPALLAKAESEFQRLRWALMDYLQAA